MPKKIFTKEQIEYLKEIANGRYMDEITKMMNEKFNASFTEAQIRDLKNRQRIKSNVKTRTIRQKRLFTQEQEKFIYENLQGNHNEEIAKMVNKKFGTSYTTEQIRNLKNRRGWNSGLTGHFAKGHVPWNKGKKGILIGGVETQFKKGHKPVNYRPIGSERVNVEGYTEVKTADPNVWESKHRIIWEQYHKRPVPDGYAVIFGDGDITNFDIDNLILVSRAQLLYLNRHGLIKNSAEITKVAVTLADIDRKLNEKKKAK